MTLTETIVFTLLPNGARSDNSGNKYLKFSVFVSPRLVPPPLGTNTLQDFSIWLDWPSTLRALTFSVNFSWDDNSLGPLSASVVSNPDSSVWGKIFPSTTFVQPYSFDSYTNINILSYPSANVHAFIQNQYLAVAATNPQSFPPISTLGNNGFGRIGFYNPGGDFAAVPGPPASRASVDAEIFSLLLASDIAGGRHAIDYNSSTYKSANPNSLPSLQQKQFVQEMDFEQVNLFYNSLKPASFIADNTPSNPAHGDLQVPKIDFHREVSALSQYTGTSDSPGLMRQLGLIFDLEVQVSPTDLTTLQTSSSSSPRTVQLEVSGFPPTSAPPVVAPLTAYKIDTTKTPIVFVAQVKTPANPDLGNGSNLSAIDNGIGMLLLANGNYNPIQIDLDAAAIRALEFAIAMLRLGYGPNRAPDTPQNLSLPSLKSGGISITKTSRAYALALTLANAQANNSNLGNSTLYAEDLVRGYRVDAYNNRQTSPTKWLSLCHRMGVYKWNGTNPPTELTVPDDEGWVAMGVTQNVNPPAGQQPTLNLHENMVRWKGWSLAAPRPQSIKRVSQDNAQNTETIDNYDAEQALSDSNNSDSWKNNNPPINIPLSVTFQAYPGSLPTLRFGRTYYMRARAVDLAGNGLPVDDTSIADVSNVHPWLTPPITYGRFEPVQAPTVVLREPLNPAPPAYVNSNPFVVAPAGSQYSPGESLDRLVLRSMGGKGSSTTTQTDVTNYNSSLNSLLGLNPLTGRAFFDHSDRNIAPPRTTESMAEFHGMFDDSAGKFNTNGTSKYADIVARDQWTFDQYQTSLPNCELMNYPSQPNSIFGTSANADDRNVNYLADPMAKGATFAFFNPNGNLLMGLVQVPFDSNSSPNTSWPAFKLFKLTLKEGPLSAAGAGAGGELVVTLPPGFYVDVQLSSYLDPKYAPSTVSAPQTMGVLGWVQQKMPAQLPTLAKYSQQGRFWMITPYRKLRLVHAVQQPAGSPGIPKFSPSLGADRQLGNTFASLSGGVMYHGTSTGRLDILAAWEEPVDDPGQDPYNPQPVKDGQSWGSGTGITAPGATSAGGVHHAQHVAEYSKIPPLDLGVNASLAIPPSAQTPLQHEFGDTKRRLVRYTAAATTRYLEYLPDQVWKDAEGNPILDANGLPGANSAAKTTGIVRYANDDVLKDPSDNTGWTTILDVSSTARPAKPQVLYVVPTFAWSRKASTEPYLPEWSSTGRTKSPLISLKSGQGLRVYMDRPWYSSGFGELLGIVLWPGDKQGNIIPPDSLKHLVTQWGQDPLWASAGRAGLPNISNFKATASNKNPNVTLEETGDNVIIVPYNVAFDKARNLWYADLQLVLSTYLPFIRLALVRYQPNSVSPAYISPVVLADYAQITPDRGLAVTGSQGSSKLHVVLIGTFPQAGTEQSVVNAVLVRLQSRQSGVPDPDLGWNTTNVSVQLTPNNPNAPTTYQGDITLPAPRGTAGTDYRLVVAEYEHYQQDAGPVVPPPPYPDILNPFAAAFRLVYAETVPI